MTDDKPKIKAARLVSSPVRRPRGMVFVRDLAVVSAASQSRSSAVGRADLAAASAAFLFEP